MSSEISSNLGPRQAPMEIATGSFTPEKKKTGPNFIEKIESIPQFFPRRLRPVTEGGILLHPPLRALKLGRMAHEGHSVPSLGQMLVCSGPGEAGQGSGERPPRA